MSQDEKKYYREFVRFQIFRSAQAHVGLRRPLSCDWYMVYSIFIGLLYDYSLIEFRLKTFTVFNSF